MWLQRLSEEDFKGTDLWKAFLTLKNKGYEVRWNLVRQIFKIEMPTHVDYLDCPVYTLYKETTWENFEKVAKKAKSVR